MNNLKVIEQLADAIIAIKELIESKDYRGIAANDCVLRQLMNEFSYFVAKNQREQERDTSRDAGAYQKNPDGTITKLVMTDAQIAKCKKDAASLGEEINSGKFKV